MDRRRFLQLSAGAVAMSALSRCEHRSRSSVSGSVKSSKLITASDFHSTRRFVETAYGRIAYVERGTGQAALFLHGFPLNGFQWRGALERLSAYRRCVVPDFLGLGYTQLADGQSVEPNAQVAMLAALLDSLSISAADIVANDSGGAIAQLFVATHLRRVRTLLLTNCDTEPDSPPPAVLPVIELASAGRFAGEWLAPWVADKALARSEKGIVGLCYMDPTHPTDEAIDYYLGPLVSSPQRKAQTNAYAIGLAPIRWLVLSRHLSGAPCRHESSGEQPITSFR